MSKTIKKEKRYNEDADTKEPHGKKVFGSESHSQDADRHYRNKHRKSDK